MTLYEKIRRYLAVKTNIVRFSSAADFRTAATLVPIFKENDEYKIIYIQRTRSFLANGEETPHSGQIAFPGGKVEADESELQAALRETHEEIDLNPQKVEVLGKLGEFSTHVSGFLTHIFLGQLEMKPQLKRSKNEVDKILFIPISALLEIHQSHLNVENFANVLKLHYHCRVPDSGEEICIWGMTGRATWCLLEMITEIGY